MLAELIGAMTKWPGVGASVATKTLHKKRPALIPLYVRQLRDWKVSVDARTILPHGLEVYGGACGWTLARAHARPGDAVAIASYPGSRDRFERAVAEFARAYADLNEKDHRAVVDAIAQGRVSAVEGV
jgi:hypothetical protein